MYFFMYFLINKGNMSKFKNRCNKRVRDGSRSLNFALLVYQAEQRMDDGEMKNSGFYTVIL